MASPEDDHAPTGPKAPIDAAMAALAAVARRADFAVRLEAPMAEAVLRSIVDATVALFSAEAASLALHDPGSGRLVFKVAAGQRGAGVVGLSIAADEGVAGYVFTSGQPIALADVASDARFGHEAAGRTGYVPRSMIAVPLVDEVGNTIGVLEVLDRRGEESFDLRDIELASVFARQAAVAIRASRLELDTAGLLRSALRQLDAGSTRGTAQPTLNEDTIETLVTAAIGELEPRDDGDALWGLADDLARLRAADANQVGLIRDILALIIDRSVLNRAGQGGGRS